MTLDATIQAVLFYKAEPVSEAALAKLLGCAHDEVVSALEALDERLSGSGLSIVRANDAVELRTAPEAADIIDTLRTEERSKDLGKAGLETLSIVLYRGPVTRAQIDYIRGVNSAFILRHLLIRGLVERIPNPDDQRSFLYRPTLDLLGHLSVASLSELPEYQAMKEELAAFDREAEGEKANNE